MTTYTVSNSFVPGGVETFSVADGKVTIYPTPGSALMVKGEQVESAVLDAVSAGWYLRAIERGYAKEVDI